MDTSSASHNTANVFALSVVVIVNWLIAHIATSWVMPQEVQSSAQALVAIFAVPVMLRWQKRVARVELARAALTPIKEPEVKS